ncbi:MAG: hypothetical protein Q9160_003605 [Pyrenula sp. 1 TL-2023]
MDRVGSIHALPESIRAQIKSSAVINSVNDVALELLKNALDASSSQINIEVDYPRGDCVVGDDGIGISPSAFEQGGSLCRMFHTSKFPPDGQTHGQYGQFLASVSALSVLTITSRQIDGSTQPLISFHGSHTISRLENDQDHPMLFHQDHGTVVSARSLFSGLPVRVKQRAIRYENSSSETADIEELKRRIISHLLAWPQKCKVILHERSKRRRFIFNNQQLRDRGSSHEMSKSRSFHLDSICALLRQGGYIQHVEPDLWTAVSARSDCASVRAAMSLAPAPSKQVQFVSIGIHPLKAENDSLIRDEINRLFALSDFGAVSEDCETDDDMLQASDQARRSTHLTSRQSKSLAKSIDRWPMFFVKIDVREQPSSQQINKTYDLCQGCIQDSQSILDLLRSMILQFLEQHHFRPRKPRRKEIVRIARSANQKAHPQAKAEVKARSSNASCVDAFQAWSRVKSSSRGAVSDLLSGLPGRRIASYLTPIPCATLPLSPSPENHLVSNMSVNTVEAWPASASCTLDSEDHFKVPNTAQGDEVRIWTNPLTGDGVYINARTGQAVSDPKSTVRESEMNDGESLESKESQGIVLKQSRRLLRVSNPSVRPFIHDALEGWENPIFKDTESPIYKISFGAECAETHDIGVYRPASSNGAGKLSRFFEQTLNPSGKRLSRSDIELGRVLGQVDQKFILLRTEEHCKSVELDSQPSAVLVLIDQHAADERCKIEQILEEMFYSSEHGDSGCIQGSFVKTLDLPKPIVFFASTQETTLLQQYRTYFLSWGISYKMGSPDLSQNSSTYPQSSSIIVTRVPSVIAERVRLHPKLLIDLLRFEIWSQRHHSRHQQNHQQDHQQQSPLLTASPTIPTATQSQDLAAISTDARPPAPAWITRLQSCPRGLLDLLNSRACRSAIMFNDVLSIRECQALVRRLAACRFPFVCAHGRPSMVVLGSMGEVGCDDDGAMGIGRGLGRERDSKINGDDNGGVGCVGGEDGFAERCKEWMRT